MKLKKYAVSAALVTAMGFGPAAQAADVVIGVPNWPSVRVTAHVLKVVMEDNLGVEVELQNGTNPVVFEAMDSGAMHVHPEVWLPNQANLENKFVKEKKSVRQNPNGVNGDQAMCVTKSTAERIGIKDLAELSNPDMAKNFDSDGDGKGEIWIGAAGWASTNVEKIRAKSYGYAETMQQSLSLQLISKEELPVVMVRQMAVGSFTGLFVFGDVMALGNQRYDVSVLAPDRPYREVERRQLSIGSGTARLES